MRKQRIVKKKLRVVKRNPRLVDDHKFALMKRALAHELFSLHAQGYQIWQVDECIFKTTDLQRTAWSLPN